MRPNQRLLVLVTCLGLGPSLGTPALAQEINQLLDHEDTLQELRTKGYQHGRSMVWAEVARGYLGLADEALNRTVAAPIPQVVEGDKVRIINGLPEVTLGHLRVMTDGTGMLQHAKYSVPDRTHGYCVDDNSRALVVAGTYFSLFQDKPVDLRCQTVMVWGGLRGAVALALALSLPVTLDYWWTVQSIAFGVVLFTLFVQAPTIRLLIDKLDIRN